MGAAVPEKFLFAPGIRSVCSKRNWQYLGALAAVAAISASSPGWAAKRIVPRPVVEARPLAYAIKPIIDALLLQDDVTENGTRSGASPVRTRSIGSADSGSGSIPIKLEIAATDSRTALTIAETAPLFTTTAFNVAGGTPQADIGAASQTFAADQSSTPDRLPLQGPVAVPPPASGPLGDPLPPRITAPDLPDTTINPSAGADAPPAPPSELDPLEARPAARSARDDLIAGPALDVPATPGSDGNIESLRDAIVAALKESPDIQIALARQDDARYGIHQANAGYMPHVDMFVAVGGEATTPNAADPTRLQRTEATVNINQNVWDFGVTLNDIKRARADYRSAEWATRERIEQTSYEISDAYLSVLEKQKLVGLSEAEIKAHEKILRMVTIQNDLGLNTPADVSRAKARLEGVKAELLDRQSALEQAREGYRRLTLHLPGTAVDLPPTATALPMDANTAVDMIDTHSPRMAQAVQNRRSLDRQRASQTGTFFPRVGLLVQGNMRDDVMGATGYSNDARAMVTLSYSFFNGGADIALRNRISARLREADFELDRRRREVEQDIRIDFSAMEAARNKIATINSEIESAQKVDQLYRQQFREGRRSVFDLLDSQQLLFDARAKQITNETAKNLGEFRVLQKLGGLFELVSGGEALPDFKDLVGPPE